jgi:hypothetical protein
MFETIHEGRELPQFTIRQLDLPDLLDWQVSESHYVLCKVQVVGLRNRSDLPAREDRPKLEADLQVESIQVVGYTPINTKEIERKEFESLIGKVKSGEM